MASPSRQSVRLTQATVRAGRRHHRVAAQHRPATRKRVKSAGVFSARVGAARRPTARLDLPAKFRRGDDYRQPQNRPERVAAMPALVTFRPAEPALCSSSRL